MLPKWDKKDPPAIYEPLVRSSNHTHMTLCYNRPERTQKPNAMEDDGTKMVPSPYDGNEVCDYEEELGRILYDPIDGEWLQRLLDISNTRGTATA